MTAFRRAPEGSVLPSVLIFSLIAALIVTAFVSGQYLLARPTLTQPAKLQALCNARSGVWKALEMLRRGGQPDSLKGINTLDSAFNGTLFGKTTDTAALPHETLVADSSPVTVHPYSCDSFGACEVSLSYRGCFEALDSKGTLRKIDKSISVVLGGSVHVSPDTAYFFETGLPLQGNIGGKGHIGSDSVIVRQEELKALISRYNAQLSTGADTIMPQTVLLIQHNDEFEKIPDFVKGPLTIDGTHFDLSWKKKRRVTVLGDIQIFGKTNLEGLEFIASGDITCADDCRLLDVTLVAAGRMIMADRAVFSGTAIAATNMLIHGQASIERRSMLIATGEGKTPPLKPGMPPKPRIFSITCTERATIDATVIALKDELGVKIDKAAAIKGVIWTKGFVSIAGKLFGVVHAKALVDADQAIDPTKTPQPIAILPGSAAINRIDDANRYYFPFFMGKLAIIQWQE